MTYTNGGVSAEYIDNTDELNRYKTAVLLLHGWGGSLKSFAGVYNALSDMGCRVFNYAFPETVPETWGVYDYAAHVASFIEDNGLVNPIIIGHSFGGRVGIILASRGMVGKLVLVDSAGLKPRYSIKRNLAVLRYRRAVKHGKPLDGYGSADYNNTSGGQRKVFVRIVNAHLDNLTHSIKCPTLIVWGRNDKDTPPYMARRLHRSIKGSRLCFLDGGHFAYVDSHFGFVNLLKTFVI
ncbi:MAG: alpha/beta hydrolase [Clostridiales bacterium]|nr:alpha/beta hydrolase [Clostridiales bacterium]